MLVKYLKIQPIDWVGDDFETGWWIRDERIPDVLYLGPYETKKAAEEIRISQNRFWRQNR